MPQGVNPLKPRNPFVGTAASVAGVKTAAQRAKEAQAAAAARARQLQMQNSMYDSRSTNPGGTFTDNQQPGKTIYNPTASGANTNAAFEAAARSGTLGGNPVQAAASGGVGAVGGSLANVGGAALSGGNPGFPTGSGYQAQTQLGKSYRDLMLPSAWEDPEALIDTFYRVGGLDKGSGDYGTQLESADNLGILYMALMGEGANQGNANFVDWASNYLSDQRRAGGVSLAPSEIWQAIVDPSANSPLSYYLNNPTLTPEDQVNNFMSTMRYGMESTLPAPILNALMAQVDQMGREFRSLRNTSAGNASFTEYLQSRPGSLPWGVLGGL